MKANELITDLLKLRNNPCYENLDVFIGNSAKSDLVVALVKIDKPNKYRYTHIRIAESIDQLIQDILNNYELSEDELPQKVIPLAGFSSIDLVKYL